MKPILKPEVLLELAMECVLTDRSLILGRSRKYYIAEDRQIAMYLIRHYGRGKLDNRLSLQTISRLFNRDHSTVLYALKTVEDRYKYERLYKEKLNKAIDKFEILIQNWYKNDVQRKEDIKYAVELLQNEGYYVYVS